MTNLNNEAAPPAAKPPAPTYEAQVLFVYNTRCGRCGAIHTTSQLFACDPLAPNGRHMFPAKQFADHLPCEKIALDTRFTPICHSCTDSLQPITDRESAARWADTIKRKRAEEAATRKASAPSAKRETTLEDLI
jgi:hypothetical protein